MGFKGVKFIVFPDGGFDFLSSLQLFVRADFLPLSERWLSCLSLFLGLSPQAIIASSTFMYFVALYSVWAIVFGSFLQMEKRNSPGCNPLVKVVTRTLSSASSIKKASLLKWVTYDLRLSSSCCLMFSMAVEDLLCLQPPMKCVTKCPLNSLNVETVFQVSLLNHTLASPFSMVGKALDMILPKTPCRCMRVLNDIRCSSESLNLSYASTCDT